MKSQISMLDLQAAVDKAVSHAKLRPGPIIVGFVAPDTLSNAAAEKIAAEIVRTSGLKGRPVVAASAEGSHLTAGNEMTTAIPPRHIIIGLVAEEL